MFLHTSVIIEVFTIVLFVSFLYLRQRHKELVNQTHVLYVSRSDDDEWKSLYTFTRNFIHFYKSRISLFFFFFSYANLLTPSLCSFVNVQLKNTRYIYGRQWDQLFEMEARKKKSTKKIDVSWHDKHKTKTCLSEKRKNMRQMIMNRKSKSRLVDYHIITHFSLALSHNIHCHSL